MSLCPWGRNLVGSTERSPPCVSLDHANIPQLRLAVERARLAARLIDGIHQLHDVEWGWIEGGSQLEGIDPTLVQPAPEEKPMRGQKEIAAYMGWSLDKLKHKSKELQSKGVLIRTMKGKPPHLRVEIIAYSSTVKAYIEEESKQKESKQKK